MEETTAVVYATDDEEDVLGVKDLLERQGITCALLMRSDNYLFGPGILNDGLPRLAGRYAIQVSPEDIERSTTLIEEGRSLTVAEAPTSVPGVTQSSTKTAGASSDGGKVSAARPAGLLESIVFVVVFAAAAFAISWALHLVGFRFRLAATVDMFVRIAAFYVVAAVIKNRLHRPALDMANLAPAPFGTFALTVLGYIGIFLLLPPIDDFLARAIPFYERSIQIAQRLYVASDVVGTLLRSSLVTPILEETLFRGIVFAGLSRHHRLSTALVVSSLIFALYHLNPAQFLGPLLSGLLFAAAYHRSASLLPCFLGHALNNFVWFVSSFYHSVSNPEKWLFDLDPSLDVPRIIVGAAILILSVAVLLHSTRKSDNRSSEDKAVAPGSSAI